MPAFSGQTTSISDTDLQRAPSAKTKSTPSQKLRMPASLTNTSVRWAWMSVKLCNSAICVKSAKVGTAVSLCPVQSPTEAQKVQRLPGNAKRKARLTLRAAASTGGKYPTRRTCILVKVLKRKTRQKNMEAAQVNLKPHNKRM